MFCFYESKRPGAGCACARNGFETLSWYQGWSQKYGRDAQVAHVGWDCQLPCRGGLENFLLSKRPHFQIYTRQQVVRNVRRSASKAKVRRRLMLLEVQTLCSNYWSSTANDENPGWGKLHWSLIKSIHVATLIQVFHCFLHILHIRRWIQFEQVAHQSYLKSIDETPRSGQHKKHKLMIPELQPTGRSKGVFPKTKINSLAPLAQT